MTETTIMIAFGVACVYAMLTTDSKWFAMLMLLSACGAFTWAAEALSCWVKECGPWMTRNKSGDDE